MRDLPGTEHTNERAHWNRFSNLKVQTKVLLGFSVILLLLAAVSLLSYRGFSVVATQFGHYAGVVDVASDAGSIERDVVKRWQGEYPDHLTLEKIPLEKGAALLTYG